MKTEFEEMSFEDGFITIFDEDGLITIQMKIETVIEIINYFDLPIKNRQPAKSKFMVEGEEIELYLSFDENIMTLQGLIGENFYHDFDIEECKIKAWDKIVKFVKKCKIN